MGFGMQEELMEILVRKPKQNWISIWGYSTLRNVTKTKETTAEAHCWDLEMV